MLKHPPRADKIHTKHRKHSKIPGLSYPWFSTSMEWVRFAKKKKKRENFQEFWSSQNSAPGRGGLDGVFPKSSGIQQKFPEPAATQHQRGGKKNSLHLPQLCQPFLNRAGIPQEWDLAARKSLLFTA